MDVIPNNSAIQIRFATPDDLPSIETVLAESFSEYRALYTPEAFAATTPSADQIRTRMDEGPVWVAVQDDEIVGTVSAVPRGDALYIRGMAVLPTARGQRVGEKLLEEIERYASTEGFGSRVLSTTPFLGRAIALYERAGFRRSDQGPHDLFGTPLFTMVKQIGDPISLPETPTDSSGR